MIRSLLLVLSAALLLTGCATHRVYSGPKADYVVVEKSGKSVTLWSQGQVLRTYAVMSLGPNPYGHKVFEGDGRTPEGLYIIDEKHESERFQKFLRISYPNAADVAKAKSYGMKPGGFVGLHGDKGGIAGYYDRQKENWTEGCISVRNYAINEIYDMVEVGTPILIRP